MIERVAVTYVNGEFAGESGQAVIAMYRCGTATIVPWSVSPRRAA